MVVWQAERLLAELEALVALVGPLSAEPFPWMPHPVPEEDKAKEEQQSLDAVKVRESGFGYPW